jgi:hypothetical protein
MRAGWRWATLRWPLVCIVFAVSCGSASAPSGVDAGQPPAAVRAGAWGGTGVALEVAGDGGFVEFDCAHGRLTAALTADDDGRFDVPGTYVRERGGPQGGADDPGRPARYRGRVAGESMTLTVAFDDASDPFGPFALTYGQRGLLRKCL